MIELSQSFGFEAAHTLDRAIDTDASRRVHGHSYAVDLVLRGEPDPVSSMLIDLGEVEAVITRLRLALDHRLLDEVEGLGPGTMENIATWIFDAARDRLPMLARVVVRRPSLGQACAYEPVPGPALAAMTAPDL